MPNVMLRPSTGKTIIGIACTETKFQGITTLDEIVSFGLIRPSQIDKEKQTHGEREAVRDAFEARKAVQRPFDKARILRAKTYAQYIEQVEQEGRMGGTPAITLYTNQPGMLTDRGLELPHNATITAIDGETQTEARFILREDLPATGANSFAITLYHGISHDHAKQILADYNTLGHPMSVKQTAQMNKTGPLTQAALEAAKRNDISPDRLNHRGATGNSKCWASYAQLFHAMAGADANGHALTRKMSPIAEKLNRPFGFPIRNEIVQIGTRLLGECASPTSPARAAPALVWQVAGHLAMTGKKRLNWAAGIEAYRSQTMLRERLQAISQAL